MAVSNSKRNLLFGRISARRPIRPPWAISEEQFIELCNRCGECTKECPKNVIKIADGGFPEIDFTASGCDFCEICVAVCKPEALSLKVNPAFNIRASIGADCFSERGVICKSCGEVCETRAIQFKLAVGGITHVVMNNDLCNGCGECVSICPANAITIKHNDETGVPV